MVQTRKNPFEVVMILKILQDWEIFYNNLQKRDLKKNCLKNKIKLDI